MSLTVDPGKDLTATDDASWGLDNWQSFMPFIIESPRLTIFFLFIFVTAFFVLFRRSLIRILFIFLRFCFFSGLLFFVVCWELGGPPVESEFVNWFSFDLLLELIILILILIIQIIIIINFYGAIPSIYSALQHVQKLKVWMLHKI